MADRGVLSLNSFENFSKDVLIMSLSQNSKFASLNRVFVSSQSSLSTKNNSETFNNQE
jgi:hypothetical protein